jgi:hypothetical protein
MSALSGRDRTCGAVAWKKIKIQGKKYIMPKDDLDTAVKTKC